MLELEIISDGERLDKVPIGPRRRYVIGRRPGCDVVLPDPHVSRDQLSIGMDESGSLELVPLGGKNPVFVNGNPSGPAQLRVGDRINVGNTLIEVQLGSSSSASDSSVEVGDWAIAPGHRRLEIEDATDSLLAEETVVVKSRQRALYQLAEHMVGDLELDALFDVIMDHALLELPARRSFIALGDPDLGRFDVVRVRTETGDATIELSRSILDEIQAKRTSLLIQDLDRAGATTSPDGSIAKLGISAFMCAPMVVNGSFVGLLYVDQSRDDPAFESHDLRYLQSVARLLALAIDDRLVREQLQKDNFRLRSILRRREEFVAASPPMIEVLSKVSRAAKREATVLILGETGTGKERIARMLHDQSDRNEAPFVAFNCGLSTPALLEAELFGHKRGAFTDAHSDRQGKFQLAHGGTLFLDEIGDMPSDAQVKLLRVLQERELWPVGAEAPIDIDVRVVAATHCDLDKLVKSGAFREDLYYRIAVLELELPALRERGEDIVALAESFLPEPLELEAVAKRALTVYPWPGNVRELQNAMEQASFNASSDVVRLQDLPSDVAKVGRREPVTTRLESLDEVEARHIRKVLASVGDNKVRAAEVLGISRGTLYKKIEKYGI